MQFVLNELYVFLSHIRNTYEEQESLHVRQNVTVTCITEPSWASLRCSSSVSLFLETKVCGQNSPTVGKECMFLDQSRSCTQAVYSHQSPVSCAEPSRLPSLKGTSKLTENRTKLRTFLKIIILSRDRQGVRRGCCVCVWMCFCVVATEISI